MEKSLETVEFQGFSFGAAGGIRIIGWAENAVKWSKQNPLFATVFAASVKIVQIAVKALKGKLKGQKG